jgi:hypothetical protein
VKKLYLVTQELPEPTTYSPAFQKLGRERIAYSGRSVIAHAAAEMFSEEFSGRRLSFDEQSVLREVQNANTVFSRGA